MAHEHGLHLVAAREPEQQLRGLAVARRRLVDQLEARKLHGAAETVAQRARQHADLIEARHELLGGGAIDLREAVARQLECLRERIGAFEAGLVRARIPPDGERIALAGGRLRRRFDRRGRHSSSFNSLSSSGGACAAGASCAASFAASSSAASSFARTASRSAHTSFFTAVMFPPVSRKIYAGW